MQHPKRDFLTIEQIADRWGMGELDVHQLLLARSLPQTFLVSGSAFLMSPSAAGSPTRHPLTTATAATTWVLASTILAAGVLRMWPLSSVNRVYDFVVDGRSEPSLLENLCLAEMAQPAGWRLEFEPEGIEIIGRNRFHQVAEVLQDSAIVLTDALIAVEEHLNISPKLADQEQPRDSRKQRCRAVAQILWERDPRATLPDIFQSEWVQRIACESRPPSDKTFREWVKDLNPDRSPGRRSI